MNTKPLYIPLALLVVTLHGLSLNTASAFVVFTYNPLSFFTATGAPTLAQTAALDAAVGSTGFIMEDFEDTTLIPDLSLNVPVLLETHGNNLFFGAWDATHALNRRMNVGEADTIITYALGANVFGLGVSGLEVNQRLQVNGIDFGAVTAFTDYEPPSVGNDRNIYFKIERQFGDAPITEVRITAPTTSDDFAQIDHITISPIPEPSRTILLALTTMLVAAGRRRKFHAC